MNRFLSSLLLLAIVVVETSSAFVVVAPSSPLIVRPGAQQKTSMPSSTTTQLHLKIKVDPDEVAKGANAKGNAKMAAYGGSVLIALALPFVFLVWSAVH
mmetsp:Transcript_13752/g.20151  ORF Transcript_13752/g.20151 Transcript_13752/m.20151 type:complete len:99 (-) Transcript_13752:254-550(-)|eukprot:CAMPEP_0194049222 /NCGR_PEP_ID=MMETSP0009_2-20130614/30045_1 /TAXON_ID=210454 /ORGANISM="Grammatophora oceanica, Strain CCMP 410" /LENGTH=98 /DNA_ID=CAMNT_0038695325 /DNA_START=107 /DNA_END=403 /DNA_ORIENTATION=+